MKLFTKLALALSVLLAFSTASAEQSAHYRITTVGVYSALLPDPAVTPGQTVPADTTVKLVKDCAPKVMCICAEDFTTRTWRHTTPAMKIHAYQAYGAIPVKGKCCEVDHDDPLELAGADSRNNTYAQPYVGPDTWLSTPLILSPGLVATWIGAHEKDDVENYLHKKVCAIAAANPSAGNQALADAQKQIMDNWVVVWVQMKAGH